MEPEFLIPALAIIGNFSCIFLLIYLFFTGRHKQRMALIEHGKNADIFYSSQDSERYRSLKWGIVGVMIGVGLMFSDWVDEWLGEPLAIVSMTLIWGGMGLIFYYIFITRKESKM
ncbi:MAG: DUF6249 domain-containing protein [Saprospiraceae bacterium]